MWDEDYVTLKGTTDSVSGSAINNSTFKYSTFKERIKNDYVLATEVKSTFAL